jgi:hypothetical protein
VVQVTGVTHNAGTRGGSAIVFFCGATSGVTGSKDVALVYDVLIDQSNCDAGGDGFKNRSHL